MNEKITKPQAKPTVDREAVRVLAIELGAREAARRLGLKEGTVLSWASRYKWNLTSQRNVGRPAISAIELQSKPGDVLIAEHQRLEGQTRTGLSKAAATAAEHAGEMQGNEVLSQSKKLRDITHLASKVFGWDKKNWP
jgi:Putative ATPase subunit of terminase (gpP-like)